MINKPTNAHEIPWDGLPHFFLNTSFLTSGQNSMNALLPIFPSTPYRQRRAAWPASASLSARHVLEKNWFPRFPANGDNMDENRHPRPEPRRFYLLLTPTVPRRHGLGRGSRAGLYPPI